MNEPITFDAIPIKTERGHVRLPLPFDPIQTWGRATRHYVTGQIAGTDFRGSVGFQGGTAFLVLSKQFREQAGIDVGKAVRAVIAQATAPAA